MEDVKLAVVGLGGWGKNVVRSFGRASGCQLTYICDSNPRSLDAHQLVFPQSRPTTDFQQVLADSQVDAVAIATPAPLHYPMAEAALLAGKHVFVEKPMTLIEQHAEALIELAERQQRKLMVGHLLEYHPAVNYIKQYLAEGCLGEIYYMYCQRLNLGVVRQTENAFWSLAPHDIAVALYLLGQEPAHVTASGQSYLQAGVEDVVFAQLHFPRGQVAQIHVSWLDPHKERRMVLVGSEKMLVFDDMQPTEKIRIYDKNASVHVGTAMTAQTVNIRHGDIHIPHLPSADQPLDLETQHFVDCILQDRAPRSDGHDGLRVVRILAAVDRQLRKAASPAVLDTARRRVAA